MKKTFYILMLIISVVASLLAYPIDTIGHKSNRHAMFDPNRNANDDIQNAILDAQKSGKRILLDVGGEWCIWCHRLDSLFIQNKDLDDYLYKHYIVVKINVSKENDNKEFLSQYPKVAGYPHLFVLDKKGILLWSQDTGELEFPKGHQIKGHDKLKVFEFLKKWTK